MEHQARIRETLPSVNSLTPVAVFLVVILVKIFLKDSFLCIQLKKKNSCIE